LWKQSVTDKGAFYALFRIESVANIRLTIFNPLTPIVAIKHPVPDRVKPSFVIFDIRAH